MPVTSVSRSTVTPAACAAFANPIVTPFGSAMPSCWQNVAARLQHWVTPWARPIAYGAMLFLIITNAGIGGAFIYFQF